MAPSSCLGVIPWNFIPVDPNINNILEVEIKFKNWTSKPCGLLDYMKLKLREFRPQ